MNIAFLAVGLAVAYMLYTHNVSYSGLPPNSFTMYYAEWCPHCTSVMPEFEAFANSYSKTMVRAVEQKQNNEFKVKGFPTFVYTDKHGMSTVYKGARHSEAWKTFLEEKNV